MVKNSKSGDGFNHDRQVHHQPDDDEPYVRSFHFLPSILSPNSFQESPDSANEESYVYMPPDVGLTPCLKLRSFFDPDT